MLVGEAYEGALAGGAGDLGGRWVPSDYARDVYAGENGRSRPEVAAETLVKSCPAVTRYRRYNTPSEDRPRTLDVDLSRRSAGAALAPTALVAARQEVQQSFATRRPATGLERDDGRRR